jgi:putative DNA primase/helicase
MQPALRVGGTREEIWIDLGDSDWRAVRITADGWKVEDNPRVAFVRSGPMLPLPEPKEGGSIEPLRGVLNVQHGDFVLAVGWLLEVLNPIGPYALVNVCGPSEVGKTITSKLLLRAVDPNITQLRRPSRKVEDLLIAARNGWTIGIDNVSWMTAEMADHLSMIATGISSGTRAHYTNDEEHVFTVKRPVLFNGIPSELIERSDLASRTIKLQILPITKRRTEAELEEEFAAIRSEVFGALLDELVASLRDAHKVDVERDRGLKAARLIDFERSAEAGCREMGFRDWEFVDAYYANRQGLLIISVEGSCVGRAVLAFINTKGGRKGFCGKMSDLLKKLNPYNNGARDWPINETRLSSALDRLIQPLAAVGIDCTLRVDLRRLHRETRDEEHDTQKGVILAWRGAVGEPNS